MNDDSKEAPYTVEQFLEHHNGRPVSLGDMAGIIVHEGVDDDDELFNAASDLLEATDRLEAALDRIGFEFG